MSYFKRLLSLLFIAFSFFNLKAGVIKIATKEDLKKCFMDKATLVAFSAGWVSSNKSLESCFNKWSSKYNALEFMIVDIDCLPEIMDRFKVTEVPTVLLVEGINFSKGTTTGEKRLLGFAQKKIERSIKAFFKESKK